MKKLLLLLFVFCLTLSSFAQQTRKDLTGVGIVEVKLKDSSGVFIMMWDDFTFRYGENLSEIIIVEGYSNKKEVIKAKNVDSVSVLVDGKKIQFRRYKSFRGRNFLLLNEVHRNGDYVILQSPTFADVVFHYLAYKDEVFSVLPQNNSEFLEFFNCAQLIEQFGRLENATLTHTEMGQRLDYYVSKCTTVEVNKEVKAVSK